MDDFNDDDFINDDVDIDEENDNRTHLIIFLTITRVLRNCHSTCHGSSRDNFRCCYW